MASVQKRLPWSCVTGLGMVLAIASLSPSDLHAADALPPAEWLMGVPKGSRLVSFRVGADKTRELDRRARVHVLWNYAVAADRQETTALLEEVSILNAEQEGRQTEVRLTVALTPLEAERLRVAAACGAIRIQQASGPWDSSHASLPTWSIRGIADRTQEIEASLGSRPQSLGRLQRPTLATRIGRSAERSPGTISVPVQFELQR